MADISLKTRAGQGLATSVYADKDTADYTVTVEYASTSKFTTVLLTKNPTVQGRRVDLALSPVEVEALKDCYFRIRGVKAGTTRDFLTGALDFIPASVVPGTTPEIIENNLLRPYHLDTYHKFFTEGWTWVNGQGTTGTTLSAPATAGATTLSVTSGTGLVNGIVLVTNAGTVTQKQYKVTAGGGTTTLTVTPAITTALPSGASVTPLWADNGHLTYPAGWSALAHFIANATDGDQPIIANPGTKPVVFLGNSWMVSPLAAPYTTAIQSRFPSAVVQMNGVSGNNSTQILARFDTDVPSDAAYVIFNEPGVNSVGTGESRETQQANLEAIVAKCRAIGAVPIFLGAVPLAEFPAESKAQARALAEAFALPEHFPSTSVAALDERYQQRTPSGSVAYGTGALAKDTNGSNVAFGSGALTNNTSGGLNVAIGSGALVSNTTGNGNIAIGQGALVNATANNNMAVGYSVGEMITTGENNTGFGAGTLRKVTTESGNTAIGASALKSVTGGGNVGIGHNALAEATGTSGNVGIGQHTGLAPNFNSANATTTGANQTLVGAYSGQSTPTPLNDVVALGTSALVGSSGATALGSGAHAAHANSVALGNNTTTTAANQVMAGGRDVEITDATKGVILKSPDGTRYRITVANGGALTATAI